MSCFQWLLVQIVRVELHKWLYNTTFIAAEALLGLILAFTASIPHPSTPLYLPVHFGIFATIRSATTLFTFPQYIDTFNTHHRASWSSHLHTVEETECAVILRHPRSFYWARFGSTVPVRLVGSVVLSVIVYPIAGLRSGFDHYLVFLLTLVLHSFAGVSTAMMISAVCARSTGLSSYIGILALSINIVFAGTLIPPRQVTPVIRWLHYITFTYFASIAYNQNQYGGQQGGKRFLESRGLTGITLWGAIGVLMGQIIVFNLIGMTALAWHWRRQAGKEKQHNQHLIVESSAYT